MGRKLSSNEHLLWQINRIVSQNFVMVAHLSGIANNFKKILRKSLNIVQMNQPSLRVKIMNENRPFFSFSGVPHIPLHIKTRKTSLQWIEETERELSLPLPWETGPLIRINLLEAGEKSDLLITLSHITADATAGVKFVKLLLTVCGKLILGIPPLLDTNLKLLPSILELLKPEVIQKVKSSPNQLYSNFNRTKPIEFRGDCEVPLEKRITRVIQRSLSRKDTKKLLHFSRKENATFHTVLCAALMQTITRQYRRSLCKGNEEPIFLGCLTPVNIRHLLSLPIEDNMANLISNAIHFQFIHEQFSLGDAARKTKQALLTQLKKGSDINALLETEYILKSGENPKETLSRLTPHWIQTGVTNMGVLDIPIHFNSINLEQLHYCPSINPVIKNGFALSVSGYNDLTILNFLYSAPFISEERARDMVKNTMIRLKNFN